MRAHMVHFVRTWLLIDGARHASVSAEASNATVCQDRQATGTGNPDDLVSDAALLSPSLSCFRLMTR